MGITLNATSTNNADWNVTFIFEDADTSTPIDFTGAYVKVSIKDYDNRHCLDATTDNGMIVVSGPGTLGLSVPAAQIKSLCPGTYAIGGLYQLNGATVSLFTGELSVIDGVARA